MGKGPLSKSSNSANMSASVDKCSAEEAKKPTNKNGSGMNVCYNRYSPSQVPYKRENDK